MTMWTKLPALPDAGNPCNVCDPIVSTLRMDREIAVGFGEAKVTRDGAVFYDADDVPDDAPEDAHWIVARAEDEAAKDPDHDWRIVFHAPFHGETYQRHDVGTWVLVARNHGFA